MLALRLVPRLGRGYDINDHFVVAVEFETPHSEVFLIVLLISSSKLELNVLKSVHCSACEVGVTRCKEIVANTVCKLLLGPYDRADQHDVQIPNEEHMAPHWVHAVQWLDRMACVPGNEGSKLSACGSAVSDFSGFK